MNQAFRPLICFVALAVFASPASDATALTRHKQTHHAKKAHATAGARHQRHAAIKKPKQVAAARPTLAPSSDAPAPVAEAPALSGDLAAVKNAIDLVRQGKAGEATAIEKTIDDPAGQKLVEWFILRHPDANANFS